MDLTRPTAGAAAAAVILVLAGCTTTSLNEAPIIDRSERRAQPAIGVTPPAAPTGREAPGGTYVVQAGDTLYSIALAFGQDYRDLARWNGLDDPGRLRIGQTLKVLPDGSAAPEAVAAVPVNPIAPPEVRPLDRPLPAPGATAVPGPAGVERPAAAPAAPPPPAAAAVKPADAQPAGPAAAATGLQWSWPAAGKVIDAFDEVRTKGIGIAGNEGDPVLAAGDGQVVYRGNALRGYGNLVIVKHSDDFISAYAHNRQIFVEHGQSVKRGQRIAEMGKSDAEIAKLHFEIRRQGKPVDPLRFLPAR